MNVPVKEYVIRYESGNDGSPMRETYFGWTPALERFTLLKKTNHKVRLFECTEMEIVFSTLDDK
jgi:hypothetical protein